MSKKEFKYEVIKQLAVLQEKDGYTKEVNLIKYGDLPVCLDIRKWNRNDNTMQKGITITAEEFTHFKEIINSIEEVK